MFLAVVLRRNQGTKKSKLRRAFRLAFVEATRKRPDHAPPLSLNLNDLAKLLAFAIKDQDLIVLSDHRIPIATLGEGHRCAAIWQDNLVRQLWPKGIRETDDKQHDDHYEPQNHRCGEDCHKPTQVFDGAGIDRRRMRAVCHGGTPAELSDIGDAAAAP